MHGLAIVIDQIIETPASAAFLLSFPLLFCVSLFRIFPKLPSLLRIPLLPPHTVMSVTWCIEKEGKNKGGRGATCMYHPAGKKEERKHCYDRSCEASLALYHEKNQTIFPNEHIESLYQISRIFKRAHITRLSCRGTTQPNNPPSPCLGYVQPTLDNGPSAETPSISITSFHILCRLKTLGPLG